MKQVKRYRLFNQNIYLDDHFGFVDHTENIYPLTKICLTVIDIVHRYSTLPLCILNIAELAYLNFNYLIIQQKIFSQALKNYNRKKSYFWKWVMASFLTHYQSGCAVVVRPSTGHISISLSTSIIVPEQTVHLDLIWHI